VDIFKLIIAFQKMKIVITFGYLEDSYIIGVYRTRIPE